MNEKELSNLSDIIKYVNDKNTTIDKVKLLTEVSIIGVILLNPQISGPASTAFTLAGIGIPPVINSCFERFKSSLEEERAMNTYKRCQFADFILSRLAVVQVVRNNLRGKERVFADWKISLITEENKTKIERMDQERENNFSNDFLEGVYKKEAYWDELLNSIMEVLELEGEKKENFKEKMKEQIYESYEAFKNHVIYNAKYFEIYKNGSKQSEVLEKWRELEEFLRLYGTLYRSIDEFEEWLKASTEPSIGLDFYNYNEESFEKQFMEQLSRKVIYVKGKTREEVLMYVLYIIKNVEKIRRNDTFIVDSINDWNRLNGHCKGKILIPNFNAAEVNVIPENTCVIAFSEEDFIGDRKNPIELNKRILSNMYDMLYKECDDLDSTDDIINKTNGLYASFKRLVFQGRTGKPKWEEYAGKQLVPTLLIGKWAERGWKEGQDLNDDLKAVSKISRQEYKEYLQLLKNLRGEEDPFVLSHRGSDGRIYKLSNVEESWEILFKYISKEELDAFRELAITALTEVEPKFKLPVEEHYKAGILPEKPKYSNTIKEGIVRTLIMLANMEGVENNFGVYSTQDYVDEIVKKILDHVDSSEKWFAISEYIQDLVEASPKVILDTLEQETLNPKSLVWKLFERQSNNWFSGGNYYTHILWALEKSLCFKNYAIPAIKVLAKLAERNLEYKISNSPLSTMNKALCAWIHDINASIEDKINVTRYIVKNSEIGWKILEDLLPDGGHSIVMNLTKPRYRKYKKEYYLKNKKQVFDTFKNYIEIAIEQAGNDLSKWGILFKRFSFFQFDLEDVVIPKVIVEINKCDSDEEKYKLKEQIRDLIHRHRVYSNSDWAFEEPYIYRIENEVFDAIKFDNEIFEYLYLFKTDSPPLIHGKPYDRDNYNYKEECREVSELRRKVIRDIQANLNLDIIEFIKYLTNEYECGHGLIEIGEWFAEFHESNINYDFMDTMIELKQETVIRVYVDAIYREKGIMIIQEVVDYYKGNDDLVISLLQIANINKEFLNLLESYEPETIQKYWESIWFIRNVKEKEILDLIWSKLLEYRNYRCAIDLLSYSLVEDIDKCVELLNKIAVDPGKYRIDNHDSYHIKRIFEKIYELNDLNEDSCELIFRLEWWYFEVLVDQITPKYMMKKLKENPGFLAELIQYAYKTSDEVEKEIELDEIKKTIGHQAFEILFKLKFCPCVDNNDVIKVEELRAWTKRFLEFVDQNKQSKVGRQILGECFSKAPVDKDGTFPHRAIRVIFEENYSEDLQIGFRMGIVNSRGVYTATNGEEERKISEKYQRYSDETRIEYPRMSETLRLLVEEYLINSVEERERAVYER